MDKAKSLSSVKNISIEEAFNICYNSNVFCTDIEIDVIIFVQYILKRNLMSAISYYEKIKDSENSLKILTYLYNSFKNLLIVQTMKDRKNICTNSGISYYAFKDALNYIGYFKDIELENMLYYIMTCEQGIKKGTIDERFAIDYIISKM